MHSGISNLLRKAKEVAKSKAEKDAVDKAIEKEEKAEKDDKAAAVKKATEKGDEKPGGWLKWVESIAKNNRAFVKKAFADVKKAFAELKGIRKKSKKKQYLEGVKKAEENTKEKVKAANKARIDDANDKIEKDNTKKLAAKFDN